MWMMNDECASSGDGFFLHHQPKREDDENKKRVSANHLMEKSSINIMRLLRAKRGQTRFLRESISICVCISAYSFSIIHFPWIIIYVHNLIRCRNYIHEPDYRFLYSLWCFEYVTEFTWFPDRNQFVWLGFPLIITCKLWLKRNYRSEQLTAKINM